MPSAPQGHTKQINLNGLTLSYSEWPGKKGPLICLPSLIGHKGSFTSIANRLAPEYHLCALDLRGRGDSDKPLEGYGFAYHARDILSFADALNFDSFVIIGHSFGATVGVYLASLRPQRVQAAVLLDGGADPKEKVLEAMRPVVRRLAMTYPSMEAYLNAMRALPYFHPWSMTLEHYLREDIEILEDGTICSKSSPDAIERDLDMHCYYTMCAHFPALQCPTLFIHPGQGLLGNRGHVLDGHEVAAVVASIPQCQRVDLPDVNHYTMILQDDPPVIPPIRAFLAEVLTEPIAKRAI